eukprot:CAMPEP_0118690760 /NCGR_PEP_ID=MMETSP0800-20121206/10296_1 /TAXON_ID=210618 ORGANISM="Striatella unipunctata, Strain CCMP2910" /NCGR_SAMPLE_ID=MMETSP0800 /ASSEMBLY_ACC=CAM_ASM_000638 /LENGTH=408 /DNA_ID=CAMNT_0006588449 /DNA_START=544 /DNA_END=1770 /DNA_ORIENTATION=+
MGTRIHHGDFPSVATSNYYQIGDTENHSGAIERSFSNQPVRHRYLPHTRNNSKITLPAMSSRDDEQEQFTSVSPSRQYSVQPEVAPGEIPGNRLKWFSGVVSLHTGERDTEWLSDANCYVREHCVESFSAKEEDILYTTRRGRISLHRVGIRCKFCSDCSPHARALAAVSYPTALTGIYESVKRWQRVHYPHCNEVPQNIREKLNSFHSTVNWVPTTRQFWVDSAQSLGMVDTNDGIRFSRHPGILLHSPRLCPSGEHSSTEVLSDPKSSIGTRIIYPEDQDKVPPYVFFLMRQVEKCRFEEADRFVARSKGPLGFAGFQCRHCSGHAGLGKYFPISAKSLATNSTSQNIHAHLLKCRKCPKDIQRTLDRLKREKPKTPGLVPGWRRDFFEEIWNRMHGLSHGIHSVV